MPGKQVKNWKMYEKLREKINPETGRRFTKEEAARITNASKKKKK
jgi:hypothetical protein